MYAFLGIGVLLFAGAAPAAMTVDVENATYQMALLVPGPDETPLGERAIQALQEAHLEYVREEIDRGTIVLAGRLDSTGNLRSAVLLDVASPAEARAILSRDPWVRAGRVTPRVFGWSTARETLRKAPDVLRTERCYLVLYRAPERGRTYADEEMAEIEAGHREAVLRFADGDDLVLHGPTSGETSIRAAVLLREADTDRIHEALSDDPYLRMGIAGFELYPWHVPRGALP
jgi:uncharacterized protein YciI